MAFPWSANDILTAADLNTAFGGSSTGTYTPTLTQSATVTKTTTYAGYSRIGNWIHGTVALTVTGTGTAANAVTVGLPVACVTGANIVIGTGFIFDASTGTALYKGILLLSSTTTAQFAVTSTATGGRLGTEAFTAALASGDLVNYDFSYPAA